MPIIEPDPGIVVQIVRFETDPARQRALIDAVADEAERWIKHCPGFISASFHASEDGRQMVNYAQWRSDQDFQAFLHHPETARLEQAIRAAAPLAGPVSVRGRVVRSVAAPA